MDSGTVSGLRSARADPAGTVDLQRSIRNSKTPRCPLEVAFFAQHSNSDCRFLRSPANLFQIGSFRDGSFYSRILRTFAPRQPHSLQILLSSGDFP